MGQCYFHLSLLSFHGDISQRAEVCRKGGKAGEVFGPTLLWMEVEAGSAPPSEAKAP